MILLIDNYDSFTFNLYQFLAELGAEVVVHRNDQITLDEIERRLIEFDRIVISPGPCTPAEAGISSPMVQQFAGRVPMLGVCLGIKSIGEAFGGEVVRAPKLMHGKTSMIHHDGTGVFAGLPESVHRDPLSLADRRSRDVADVSGGHGGNRRRHDHGLPAPGFQVEGVQFHPESILTPCGKDLLAQLPPELRGWAPSRRTTGSIGY